jgi:murein DD-endopeptidase MepM/ murein hydrolase activator NlpD
LAFFAFNIVRDRSGSPPGVSGLQGDSPLTVSLSVGLRNDRKAANTPAQSLSTPGVPQVGDPDIIAAPYDHYELTQGPHGFDYGHMAIDISAGKGAVIKSPINGIVSALYIDEWGNTTLVIENDHYQVTMLHGIYAVAVGEVVVLGQPVGVESNQGNTVDALGRSCRGRDCGYHMHLNIFDKLLGKNVNPLEVLGYSH